MKTKVDLTVRTAGKTVSGQSELRKAAETLAVKFLPEFSYLNVTITRDKEITELNSRYLNKKRPTDVIAFDLGPQPGKGKNSRVGEVVISVDMADRQAKENDVTLRQELMRLVTHGLVHLAGYDDISGGKKLLEMREMELKALQMLL